MQLAIFLQVSNIFTRCCPVLARSSGTPGSASGPIDAPLRGLRDSDGGGRARVLSPQGVSPGSLWLLSEMLTKPTPGLRCLYCPCHDHTGTRSHTLCPSQHTCRHPRLSFGSKARRGLKRVQSKAKGLPSPALWCVGGVSFLRSPLSSSFSLCSPPPRPDSPAASLDR